MTNNFYSLPNELINKIYCYDTTFYDEYFNVINEIKKIPKFDSYQNSYDDLCNCYYFCNENSLGIINYTSVYTKKYYRAIEKFIRPKNFASYKIFESDNIFCRRPNS